MRGAAVMITVAVAAAGCGRSGDRADVRKIGETFTTALAQGRGDAACAALAEDTRAELVSQEGEACADAIGSLEVEGGTVERVALDVDGAMVEFTSGERDFLSRTANGWRITAVGCLPKAGPPDRHPTDCELEA